MIPNSIHRTSFKFLQGTKKQLLYPHHTKSVRSHAAQNIRAPNKNPPRVQLAQKPNTRFVPTGPKLHGALAQKFRDPSPTVPDNICRARAVHVKVTQGPYWVRSPPFAVRSPISYPQRSNFPQIKEGGPNVHIVPASPPSDHPRTADIKSCQKLSKLKSPLQFFFSLEWVSESESLCLTGAEHGS